MITIHCDACGTDGFTTERYAVHHMRNLRKNDRGPFVSQLVSGAVVRRRQCAECETVRRLIAQQQPKRVVPVVEQQAGAV